VHDDFELGWRSRLRLVPPEFRWRDAADVWREDLRDAISGDVPHVDCERLRFSNHWGTLLMANKKPKPYWPKFKDLSRVVLTTGFDEDPLQHLEIAPTMKNIFHGGKRYFRLDQSRHKFPDGTWAGLYLWEGYGQELLRRKKLENETLADS
jgi:hypothetical protein